MTGYKKVAEDLCLLAKTGYDIDRQYLIFSLQGIFTNDIIIDDNLIINRIYPEKNINYEDIPKMIETEADNIVKLLNNVQKDRNIDNKSYDEENEEYMKKWRIRKLNTTKIENELNNILTKSLPILKSD